MGKQSSIGPIDPQLGGVAAYAVLDEFERAAREIKESPEKIPLWQAIIGKYHPTFIEECQNAIKLSSEIVNKWLITGMFGCEKDGDMAKRKAKRVVDKLNNHNDTKAHARHIDIDTARSYGLNVTALEEDNELQDIVLTIHHAYIETFNQAKFCKIVENHNGIGMSLRGT